MNPTPFRFMECCPSHPGYPGLAHQMHAGVIIVEAGFATGTGQDFASAFSSDKPYGVRQRFSCETMSLGHVRQQLFFFLTLPSSDYGQPPP
jgi:hypothetical protein